MENRGYKLQEFEAHSATVNCISIGNKTCRRFITGGDDNLVNLWAIGNPTSLMSLHGHTSPVESVAFDSGEVMVVAGASTGAIKLWDLEEVKMVRNLTGHRSYCTAVEFHPFGDFFASGSMDTNLKVWDIRKKGCIHTYKGHTRGINTVKFTPDGRWMVTGGLDNVVKVWDLTAGKLLRDLKFHEGHIRSIDFHPLEFLLATGSADKTVKFWDLETFELIGSTRHEATGIRATTFHPDGRALFCGLDDNLKVYSWEPVICHDGVDMKWSTLSDLCIHEGKLLGCSHFRNSVGVWIADISLIEPYVADPELKSRFSKQKIDDNGSRSPKKVGHGLKSILDSRSAYPDYESNEIKTIYVDSAGQNNTPPCADMVSALDSKKSTGMVVQKHGLPVKTHQKDDKETSTRSIVMPTVVLRDNPDDKDLSCLQRASAISRMFDSDNMLKPADNQNPSMNTYDSSAKSKTTKKVAVGIDGVVDSHGRLEAKVDSRGFCEEENLSIKNVAGKSGNILSLQTKRDHKQCSDTQNSSEEMNSVKFVNGVAVVRGRTRSLVERFEKREMANSNEDQPSNTCLSENNVPEKVSTMISGTDDAVTMTHESETDKVPSIIPSIDIVPDVVSVADKATPMVFLTDKAPPTVPEIIKEPLTVPETEKVPLTVPETEKLPITVPETVKASTMVSKVNRATAVVPKAVKKSPKVPETLNSTTRLHAPKERFPVTSAAGKRSPVTSAAGKRSPVTSAVHRRSPTIPVRHRRSSIAPVTDRTIPIVPATEKISRVTRETDKTFTLRSELPQISGEESTSGKDGRLTEDLLQTHDVILSTFRSRLTKLQVIRHFWERNDIKGAINAMKKLPDHSVQADVLSTLMEKMEILTLDLFSCLLPVLVGLLDGSLERHVKISLEMLLKLVAVFGQVIRSSISAPPPVGVDIHAEERLEHCNQCFMHLQKIQSMIPTLLRRGGLIAKSAQELNLVLQQS